MTRRRLFLVLGSHVVLVIGLLGWAVVETRRQRAEVELSLVAEASRLAGSLGPGLAAASDAVRELDEIVTWKLLDNARLLAQLVATTTPTDESLASLVESNGLDTVAVIGPDGSLRRVFGAVPVPELLNDVDEILSGRADELVHGSSAAPHAEHVAVAVGVPSGGAVLVSIHPMSARTFVQRLGIANLLDRLVDDGGVLYLSYAEEPLQTLVEASWDGLPLPERSPGPARLRPLRDRSAFEVEVPIDVAAGGRAALRVGLDGARLERAVASGMRRTLLVGIVLAGYTIATVGFALVIRKRSFEREESARRLAQAEAARRSSERLAAAGVLTAGLAHEVRSPLNAIGLAAQRLERNPSVGGDAVSFARGIRTEVQRLEGILREFLELARPVSEERRPVELAALASEVLELLRPEADSRGVRLEAPEGSVTVSVDREAVRRSLINLVRNAIEASPDGGRVRIVADREGPLGRLRVIDAGTGVAAELEDRLFDAFATTKGDGAGLGLSLVKRVAEEHGGSCSLINTDDGGAQACLCLPCDPERSR